MFVVQTPKVSRAISSNCRSVGPPGRLPGPHDCDQQLKGEGEGGGDPRGCRVSIG